MTPAPTQLYVKVGNTYQAVHAVPGQQAHGQQAPEARPASPQFDPRRMPQNVLNELASGKFVTVPSWYTISLILGGAPGAGIGGSANLRPERFFLYRVTLTTTGDTYPYLPIDVGYGYSPQMRAVEVQWQDEFTKFFGQQPCMASSLFGDSNGFLDLVQPVLFQGKQSLSAQLRRLHWPSDQAQANTRWDMSFQGLGVLPAGMEFSGAY